MATVNLVSKPEIWKDVIGFEGKYQISDLGNLRGVDRVVNSPSGGRRVSGQTMSLSEFKGYARGSLGRGNQAFIHQLVAKAFIPNPDSKPYVNHINGIKSDNRVENLEWVTPLENCKHAIDHGLTSSVGSKNNASKLTEADVKEIRRLYALGDTSYAILGTLYSVDWTTITRIVKKRRWAHVV